MAFYRLLTLVFICYVIHQPLVAQNHQPAIVGVAYQPGTIIIHSPNIRHLSATHPTGIEVNIQSQTTGNKYWHQLYRYPRIGTSFIYFDYNNPVIGRSFAGSVYLNLPVAYFQKGQLNFRFGSGLAYLTNKYDRQENPTNNIISAHVNAVIQFRLEYEYKLNRGLALVTGFGVNHYSNGGNSKPNLGVNIATGTVGLNFDRSSSYIPVKQEERPVEQRNFFAFSSSFGTKQRNEFDVNTYSVTSMALAWHRRLNHKSTTILGLEGFYDKSLYPRRQWDPRVRAGTTPDIKRVALHIGHELNFGKLALGSQVGYYLYRPYKADAAFYQLLETRYYIHKNMFLAADLKLHDVFRADVISYRLGFKI
ncbi:acyloxyacyl hydrolase [Adhaeribacter aquaticus]|uniref:acyloxyacyl hydrolase n=1 Tax=Adhaeribacter aquaticus TaxID=299567 RepID=UPI0003F941FF|nr:acyloxyacyl hydrolase [Adhaeribacter aquaticus]